MDWYGKFVVPIYRDYKIWGFVLIFILLLAAAWVFRVDIGGYVNGKLGL